MELLKAEVQPPPLPERLRRVGPVLGNIRIVCHSGAKKTHRHRKKTRETTGKPRKYMEDIRKNKGKLGKPGIFYPVCFFPMFFLAPSHTIFDACKLVVGYF